MVLGGFEAALNALKQGKKVCRSGWNGKGMWLVLVKDDEWGLADDAQFFKPKSKMGHGILMLPWVGMKTADDSFVPWLCSQTDMLADDWEAVE